MNRREAIALLTSIPAVASIERATLKPHDVLVITVPGMITMETADRIKRTIALIWPDHKSVVLSDGMAIKVVSE